MQDLEETFVIGAPHENHRRHLFTAFELWVERVASMIPTGVLWVDGGFVTHKASPPSDIDVVLRCKKPDINRLTEEQQVQFAQLMTNRDAGTQPMSGLVDAFINFRSEPDRSMYWQDTWSRVKADDGTFLADARKGFVEVRLNAS